MSFIYKRKSTGPNTELCGTPNVMFDIDELQFLIESYCPRYSNKTKPVIHDTSDAIKEELNHQYVMITCVKSFCKIYIYSNGAVLAV